MDRKHAAAHCRNIFTSRGWRVIERLRRPGRVRRRLLLFLAVVVILIGLLPLIVAKTPLAGALLSAALPGDDLRVSIGEASLGWFSTPSLHRVEVKDAGGRLLLSTESLHIDRSPISLFLNRRNLGLIEINRPTFHLAIRPDGSNLEDAARSVLAELAADAAQDPDSSEASPPLAYTIHIIDGTIHAEDLAMSRTWRVEGIELQYDARSSNNSLGSGSFAARVFDVGGNGGDAPAGQIALSLQPGGAGRQQLSCQISGLTLAPAEAWLRRFVVAAELSGGLSCQGTATWTAGATSLPTDVTTSGMLSIDRLEASAPALGGDKVRLLRVELPWQLTAEAAGLAIQDVQLRSDLGRIGLRGKIDSAALSSSASVSAAMSNPAAQHDLEMRGSIDLVRLAAMFPTALRIRGDTTVTSGTIDLAGRCQPVANQQRLIASLRTADLAATSAGRPLRWDQPINADLALTRDQTLLRLDSLKCDSEFLQIAANGTTETFAAAVDFDLNRLAKQLGQFIDLNGVELAGTGEGKLNWQQNAGHSFYAQAVGALTKLRVALTGGEVWAEPELEILATMAGILDPLSRRPIRVDTGQLQLNAQSDELDVRLDSPVALNDPTPVWPVSVEANGRIARWMMRTRPWFELDSWKIDGQSELTTKLRVAGTMFEASDTKLTVTDLQATSGGWNIREPRVEVAGNARWDSTSGELASSAAQLVTSTVALAVKDVAYRPAQASGSENVAQLSGTAAYRADVARLAAWRAVPSQTPEYRPQGALSGNASFAQRDGRILGELMATGENLVLAQKTPASRGVPAPAYETIWQEPQVTLRSRATYETATDRLDFNQLHIQSNTLQASASGQVQRLSTAAEANVTGTLAYDLAQLTPLLQPYIGGGIQLVGREQARFAVAGVLTLAADVRFQSASFSHQAQDHWSRRVRAQLEMPWTGASVYGLPVGSGRIAAALADGAIRIEPLSLAVGEGRLSAAPQVRLDPQPSELTLPAGPLLTNVRISPEVSEAMLKYVAPVLAGATQSEGLFSMQLEATRMPLGEPRRVDTAGKLTVHSVRVVPGPLAREWIALAQQIESLAKRRDPAALAARPPITLLSIRDQQVVFRVAEGRVHHQNMEFQVGDVVMRSQGSVGLDETLSLVVHVPIQDAWIAKEPLLSGLKGQSLQVPVSGTLTRPQIDPRAIAGLSQQLLQSAAGQALGGELNKALDKLFKSR